MAPSQPLTAFLHERVGLLKILTSTQSDALGQECPATPGEDKIGKKNKNSVRLAVGRPRATIAADTAMHRAWGCSHSGY